MFHLFKKKEKQTTTPQNAAKDLNEMNDFYEITIAGCKRRLKKFPVNDKIDTPNARNLI